MDTIQTGVFLAALRKSKGMTQQEVADKLNVSNKTISKWENGGGFPDITLLPDLAKLYSVTVDEIFFGASAGKVLPADTHVEYEQKLEAKNKNYTVGYILSLICFLLSLVLRFFTSDGEIVSIFLILGGGILFVTGIIKYLNLKVTK